jgi:hypothetical protein
MITSALACATARTVEPPRPVVTPSAVPAAASIATPAAPADLYAPEEALRDALAGPWEYLGTGPWPGSNRTQACAFRNQRVLLVNAYCTITEQQAFRLDVFSPGRGRVRIYAETKGPVSVHKRRDYFTFTAESEPPPGRETRIPPLYLGMSFDDLRSYDERRYNAFLPACYGGTEMAKKRGGCLGALESHERAWASQNHAFLEHASNDWYRVVHDMRELSTRYGKEPQ